MNKEQDKRNESLLDIAKEYMASTRRAKTLKEIGVKAFSIKGVEQTEEAKAQFDLDCMISGYFVCVGEDEKGDKLWDLKGRQSVTLLDRDGNYLEDLYAEDEDVIKNELKDGFIFGDDIDRNLEDDDIDSDESKIETDDIAEELGLTEDIIDEVTGEVRSGTEEVVVEKDDEEQEDDEDDIMEELLK